MKTVGLWVPGHDVNYNSSLRLCQLILQRFLYLCPRHYCRSQILSPSILASCFEKKTTSRGRPGFFSEARLCLAGRFRFRPVGENPGSPEPRKNQAAARSRRRAAWRSEFLRGEEGQETKWAGERFSVSASGRVLRARQATTKPRERPTRAARPDEAKPRRPASRGRPRAIGSAGRVFSFFAFSFKGENGSATEATTKPRGAPFKRRQSRSDKRSFLPRVFGL